MMNQSKIINHFICKGQLVLSTDRHCNKMRYNRYGIQLLFLETVGSAVIDLSTFINGGENEGKKRIGQSTEWPAVSLDTMTS